MKRVSLGTPLCVMALMALGGRKAIDCQENVHSGGAVILRSTWRDAGFGTPEATLATYLWAGREANLAKLQECMTDRAALEFAKFTEGSSKKHVLEALRNAWESADGYRIVSKRQVASNAVHLAFVIDGWDGSAEAKILRRVGVAWKIDKM